MIVSWLARLSRAIRALIRPGRSERDLDEELRFHLDMDAADWVRRGVPPSQARQAARRAFGSLSQIKEQIRELRLTSPLEHFGRDVRGALRGIRRAPGFALAVIVTLAMGIAAVTTMFSITSGILRELPVEAPDRLVHLAGIDRLRRDEGGRLLAWELLALAGQQRTLETLAAYDDETFHLGDASRFAQRWSGAIITPGVFEVLRVRPALGRTVTAEDGRPGAPPVVILGHTLWTRRYDADPTIVGREIRVNGLPRTVIGVMPDGFRFPVEQDLWTPFAPSASAAPGEGTGWTVFGRLRDGRSLDEARVEFQSLAARLAAASPATHAERTVQARSYRDELVPPRARMIFRVMLLVVSFVLLVACANAANLLLTRGMARRHEVAVRSALGGARYRILTQLLTEVLVLAAIAGLLGLAIAQAGVEVFNRMLAHELAFWMTVELDAGVILFATGAVLLSALAAGIGPARQALRVNAAEVLKERVRGSWRLGRASRWLVGGEVALSSALLAVTGLMVTGVLSQVSRFAGLAPEGVLTGRLELHRDAYPDSASRARFFRTLHQRLAAQPGVSSLGLGTVLPGFAPVAQPFEVEGRAVPEPDGPVTRVSAVSPGFFAAFQVGMVQGRDVSWSDDLGVPRVALVNRRFVERHFAGESPLGRRFRLGSENSGSWITIVGVVPDLGGRGRDDAENDGVYLSLLQTGEFGAAIVLRAAGDPAALVPVLREVLREIDPDVPLFGEDRLDSVIGRATAGEKVFGALFSAFGVAALVMATVGLFGMVAFAVRQRTRELGIRVALGARPGEIVRQVTRSALLQLGGGLAAGLVLAAFLAPLFGGALMGANPRDWRLYGVVAVALTAAGSLASWWPLRRALRLAPADVLREE